MTIPTSMWAVLLPLTNQKFACFARVNIKNLIIFGVVFVMMKLSHVC
jgi:hypothetical protein